MTRILRAWAIAVCGCLAMVGVWTFIMQARAGRREHAWHNVPDVAIAFTAVFAVATLVMFVPVFLALDRLSQRANRRVLLVGLGAFLGAVAYIPLGVVFAEAEDPQAAWGQIGYWAAHPAAFALSSASFVIAGALFGLVWPRRVRVAEHPA
jgi:hypothetical protein